MNQQKFKKRFIYSTLSEWLARASMPAVASRTSETSGSHQLDNAEWAGSRDFESALKLARGGWKEGRKRLLESQKEIHFAGSIKSLEPVKRMDVAGDEPDIGLFLEGEPECMVDFQFELTDRPASAVQKLTLDLSASASIGTDVFPRVGAALLIIADALESAGYRVEIDLSMISNNRNKKRHKGLYQWKTTMKGAEQPLDLNALAFWSMHPSALRRLWFNMYEHDMPPGAYEDGKGGATRTMPEDQDEIVVSINDDYFENDPSTFEYINKTLARFND